MAKLKYTFKNDTLFKMIFEKYPDLLKRFAAGLLGIPLGSIGQFEITNPDMPPDVMGEKFCRLDINGKNGKLVKCPPLYLTDCHMIRCRKES